MGRNVLDEHVLMLNKSWVPIDTCTVRSAFKRICMETAMFMDTSNDSYSLHGVDEWLTMPVQEGMGVIHASRTSIRVPEILVLKSNATPRRRAMQFSRRNLGRRDRMTCQYCGQRPGAASLTIDHIHPKSKGGQSSWQNCVLSCLECNTTKSNRDLKDTGMELRVRPEMKIMHPNDPHKWRKPYEPAWSPVFRVNASNLKESWKKFLPDRVLDAMKVV